MKTFPQQIVGECVTATDTVLKRQCWDGLRVALWDKEYDNVLESHRNESKTSRRTSFLQKPVGVHTETAQRRHRKTPSKRRASQGGQGEIYTLRLYPSWTTVDLKSQRKFVVIASTRREKTSLSLAFFDSKMKYILSEAENSREHLAL